MPNDIQNQRRIEKRLSTDLKITIPVSNDHTDGSWIATDVYEGEVVISGDTLLNSKIQFRSGSLLVEILSKEGVQALIGAGGGGIPEPIADGTFARKKAGATLEWVGMANDIVDFSNTHIERLIALVFEVLARSGSATPSSFEKGVPTQIDYAYAVSENDDTITQLTWDGVIHNSNFPLVGNAQDGAAEETVNRVLEITKEVGVVSNLTLQSNALIPQYRGGSAIDDFSGDYGELNGELQKVIQSSDNQTFEFNLGNTYAFFISTNANATIKDGNGFTQSVGNWGDGVSEFYKQPLVMDLFNGAPENVTMYRTRETNTATVTDSLTSKTF
jgi:hypothetical protein